MPLRLGTNTFNQIELNNSSANFDAKDGYVRSTTSHLNLLSTDGIRSHGNLEPALDNTYNLGSPGLRWQDAYFGPSSINVIASSTDAGQFGDKDFHISMSEDGYLQILDSATVVAEFDGSFGANFPAGGGGGGVSDHGELTGLSGDDHTQYLLVDGTRSMTGDLDTSGNIFCQGGGIDIPSNGEVGYQAAVQFGNLTGMKIGGAGLVDLYTQGQKRFGIDSIRATFNVPIARNANLSSVADTHIESITNNSATSLSDGDVVVMSGTRGVEKATTANQATVMVCSQGANAGAGNAQIVGIGSIYNVFVEPNTTVESGDKLVASGVTDATATVDNTETDCAKIIGYVWEDKTTGSGSRELVKTLII